ncbi:MAG: aromatic acid exporter family protein [Bacillota bacterium]|uniref:aromatic acid exporter family protein n=1 Tax=Virgibacillus TaxID=84406 RepID=UPI0003F90546|nr:MULTISPECIES: aromatic acid exporter family protein [Bacillaceae]MDY7045742.1 aromatic acid exporter family protein [Virgibacillus sp. M23]
MVKRFHFIGSRVVKTGVAVFITAWICSLLNIPAVFAVITAIVTIEPTVSDSIRKGIIRFPASAIGSAYSVFFIFLFGNSPLTYALAATFTIVTCFKLKLHAGLLVATLTAVAMVEVIHSNYFISFLIRLGTTTLGLLVSTGVNMFVLPPDYTKNITVNMESIRKQTGDMIAKVFQCMVDVDKSPITINPADQVYKKIQLTETLIRFQKDESKFHPLADSERNYFKIIEKQLICLRLIHYHTDNVLHTPKNFRMWGENERRIILHAVDELVEGFSHAKQFESQKHQQCLKQLSEMFWEENGLSKNKHDYDATTFPPELIIIYELISIYQLADRYFERNQKLNN